MITPRYQHLLQRSRSSPSSISSGMAHSDELHVLSSFTDPPSKRVHVQQTLLILVHLHLLRRFLKDNLKNNHDRTDPQLTALKTVLSAFFGQVGYVSNHFLDSSLQAVKVYFQLHTFHADLKHLPELISLASFFGADLQSVFLHADEVSIIEILLKYSGILTGLRIKLREPYDLEFLNNSSSLFPRLKQLEVEVFQRTSVSMLLIEALKTNTTVTSVNLKSNSIGAEGATALAEALKVNTSVTTVYLCVNFIEAEGARALAEALKVNASVTSINLSGNSVGAEGARALAEALKVSDSISNLDLSINSVGDEGARALADALKVNTSVTSVNLMFNSIGDEGARALAEALKVNTSVASVNLRFNSIGDEGARALAEALKVSDSITNLDLNMTSVGDEGARALEDALKANHRVTIMGITSLIIDSDIVL
ncbi:hypothetical protein GEMRC1_005354 [Eukaryota sp. GEM-RC1]